MLRDCRGSGQSNEGGPVVVGLACTKGWKNVVCSGIAGRGRLPGTQGRPSANVEPIFGRECVLGDQHKDWREIV
jgi:hypothetical protein